MTTPTPTGRLRSTGGGHDLALTRTLPVPVQDVWAGLTEPDRTARWVGRWEGTGAPGETVQLRLGFEKASPRADVEITACEAPHRLRVRMIDDAGSWDLSVDLTGTGERTELLFVMHGVDPSSVGDIGPGWEFYLDQLASSILGTPAPSFDDYLPGQRAYYEDQAR